MRLPMRPCGGRVAATGILLGLLAGTTGCGVSVVGSWSMIKAEPNREVFAIDDATFRRDGTYSAVTTWKGKTGAEAGTYKFNGFTLTLHPEKGGRRSYDAIQQFDKLRISRGEQRVILEKR